VSDALEHYRSEVHAYCWMTNHVHLLMRVSNQPVQQAVRHFATNYARRFNRKYLGVGHVFQGRHKRRHVSNDAYLKQVVRYIHRNPIEAGIVADAIAYPWSSYRAYLGRERRSFLTTETVLTQFGQQSRAARQALAEFTRENGTEPNPWSTWREIITLAEERFDVCAADLHGDGRGRHLARARCWVAQRAIEAELGSISHIAMKLGRSPSGLSRMLRQRRAGQ
jgi:REP element-mobilizing transposase RayT